MSLVLLTVDIGILLPVFTGLLPLSLKDTPLPALSLDITQINAMSIGIIINPEGWSVITAFPDILMSIDLDTSLGAPRIDQEAVPIPPIRRSLLILEILVLK